MNIALITTETLFSPSVYPSLVQNPIDLSIPALLADGFRAASNRKALITDPTISPQDWALKILASVENISIQEQWRALPILAGVLLAVPSINPRQNSGGQLILDVSHVRQFQQTFLDFVHNTIQFYSNLGPNFCQIPSTLLVLAITFPQLEDSYRRKLNTHLLLPPVIELVYQSSFGLDVSRLLKSDVTDPEMSALKDALDYHPVFSHLNSLSLLIQFLIQNSHPTKDASTISTVLHAISAFTSSLSTQYQRLAEEIGPDAAEHNIPVWRYLKLSLFSVSIAFQGYTSWLLQQLPRNLFRQHAESVSASIIEAFSHIYFIVAQISLSGFPTFDFVYYSSLDILLDPQFGLHGISSIVHNLAVPYLTTNNKSMSHKLIESSLVNRGKLIFLLNICEVITPLSPFHPINPQEVSIYTCILPLARQFLVPSRPSESRMTITYFQPVLESAHSVFLAVVSTPSQALERNNGSRNNRTISKSQELSADSAVLATNDQDHTQNFLDNEIPAYLNCVLELFPGILSPNQFSLAITTIVRAFSPPSPMYRVNTNRSQWILNQIYEKAHNEIPPGIPLPPELGTHQEQLNHTDNTLENEKNIPVPTTRAVVVSALIHSLPYIEISLLETWLNKVVHLIQLPVAHSNVSNLGPAYKIEKQYLDADLFQMISEELEQCKSTVGIRWWYQAHL